jgi:hypothetical protein
MKTEKKPQVKLLNHSNSKVVANAKAELSKLEAKKLEAKLKSKARKKKEKPSSPSAPSVEISLDSLEFAPIVEANVVWLVANVPFSIAGNRQIALSHRNWATIDCGFSAKVPEGYKLVLELSPDHKDHGLEVYKNTIVGENRVNLSVRNLGREIAVVNHRDRIALARIEPIYPLTFKVVGNS